jgi:thioredoxin-dependent peroxiredoxin
VRKPCVRGLALVFAILVSIVPALMWAQTSAPPVVGERARDFTLKRLDGRPIHLSELIRQGPVVMLMLRGWVGYQCPICNRQVGDFLSHAKELQAAGATVVMVYPGETALVQGKAEDFVTGKTLPGNVHFVIDPDLKVVSLYSLRWNAPQETAYPSTFVFDRQGIVRFVKVSRSHGDRSAANDILEVLRKLN